MTELTEATLTELERLEREATPGPWRGRFGRFNAIREDAAFVVALRNNASALIASARALAESRAECERLRERLREVDKLLEVVGFCNEGGGCVSVSACDLRTAMGKDPIAHLDAVRGRVGK